MVPFPKVFKVKAVYTNEITYNRLQTSTQDFENRERKLESVLMETP